MNYGCFTLVFAIPSSWYDRYTLDMGSSMEIDDSHGHIIYQSCSYYVVVSFEEFLLSHCRWWTHSTLVVKPMYGMSSFTLTETIHSGTHKSEFLTSIRGRASDDSGGYFCTVTVKNYCAKYQRKTKISDGFSRILIHESWCITENWQMTLHQHAI